MAANGLINGGGTPQQVQPPFNFGGRELKPGGIWAEERHGSFPQGSMSYFNDPDMAFGAPQYDIGAMYVEWARGNPHVDPESPSNKEAFQAGADSVLRAGEFGESTVPRPAEPTPPHHPSDIDPRAGTTPGFTSPTYDATMPTVPSQGDMLPQQEVVPGQIQPQPPNIDITDILGTPRG